MNDLLDEFEELLDTFRVGKGYTAAYDLCEFLLAHAVTVTFAVPAADPSATTCPHDWIVLWRDDKAILERCALCKQYRITDKDNRPADNPPLPYQQQHGAFVWVADHPDGANWYPIQPAAGAER